MAGREMSKQSYAELGQTILRIKTRARKNNDVETIRDAERCDALLQSLGIEIGLEDLKPQQG